MTDQPAQTGAVTIDRAPRRMRARFNGGILADSADALILREAGQPDLVYFPEKSVEVGYLSPTAYNSTSASLGDASYWTVEYDGQVAENAVWSYKQPRAEAAAIAGHLAFDEGKGFEIYPFD